MVLQFSIVMFVGSTLLKLLAAQTQEPTTPATSLPLEFTFCPENKSSNSEYGKDSAQISWTRPTLSLPDTDYDLESSHSLDQPFLRVKIGVPVEVTYTATPKAGGDPVSCVFMLTVIDQEAPTIDCPSEPFIRDIDPSSSVSDVPVEFDINVQDNTGSSNLRIQSTPFESGDVFPFGATRVTVNASDASGNVRLCNFDVVIRVVLDCSPSCSNLIMIRQYTKDLISVSWPQETDPSLSTKVQYLINYWPYGEKDKLKDLTTSFIWSTHSLTYTNSQSITGLESGTVYVIEITKRYLNGTVAEVGTVMQRTDPDEVKSIEISEISTTSARVSWTSGQNGVDEYRVYYTLSNTNVHVGYFPRNVNSVLLTGLIPNNAFTVFVEAISGSGDDMSTSVLQMVFNTEKLPSTNEVLNVTENSIAFVWSVSSSAEPSLLYLFDDADKVIHFTAIQPWIASPFPVYQFTELQQLTNYKIVFLRNGVNAFKTTTTQKTRPGRVSNLRAEVVNEDSLTVAWDRPMGIYPDEYKVYISPHDNTSLPRPATVEIFTEYQFRGLKNLFEYHVTVVSVKDGMESVPVNMKVTTGMPIPRTPKDSRDLTLAIIIGVSLGVFIIFLIIIIFYLLCLIPCSTMPPPVQKPPLQPRNNSVPENHENGQHLPRGTTMDTRYGSSPRPKSGEQTRIPEPARPAPVIPAIKLPPMTKPKGSSPNAIALKPKPVVGPYENEIFNNPQETFNQSEEVYVNFWGRPIKPGKSIFNRSRRGRNGKPGDSGDTRDKAKSVIDTQSEGQIYDDVCEGDNSV